MATLIIKGRKQRVKIDEDRREYVSCEKDRFIELSKFDDLFIYDLGDCFYRLTDIWRESGQKYAKVDFIEK